MEDTVMCWRCGMVVDAVCEVCGRGVDSGCACQMHSPECRAKSEASAPPAVEEEE